MNTLFIKLPVDLAQAWEVALHDAASGRVARLADCADSESLHNLAQAHAHDRVIAIAPATDCLFTAVKVSARQLKQAGNALAYLIEEQVGEDIEELHVVQGPQAEDETVPLVVVADARMAGWLAALKVASVRPQAVIPELLLLPVSQEPEAGTPWSMAFTGDQAWLRTSEFQGAALEADAADMLLSGAQAEHALTDLRLTVFGGNDAAIAGVSRWAEAQAEQGLATTIACTHPYDWVNALGRQDVGYWARHPFNLLQGAYIPRGQAGVPAPWRWAALVLLGAFLVQLSSEWIHYFYYHGKARNAQVEAGVFYKQLFPQEHRIVNLRRQMEAHLQGGGQQASMLALLTQFGQGLQGSNVQAQRLDFDADSKALNVDVDAKNVGQLESLKQKLEGQGLQIEIISANAQGDGVRGRLKVSAGAA